MKKTFSSHCIFRNHRSLRSLPQLAGLGLFLAAFLHIPQTFASETSPTPPSQPAGSLDVNDVSFLFPVPTTKDQADALISLADQAADGPIMPPELFAALIKQAKSVSVTDSQTNSTAQIDFNDDPRFEDPKNWKVAGIRVNPSALGTHPNALAKAEIPGIRLIVQPVLIQGNSAEPQDFAAHVVFNFVLPPEPSKPIRPDAVAFQKIVDDLRQIKADLNLPADPEKSKLQVHPGFSPDPAKLTSKLKDFLKANLSKPHLDGPSQFAAISFMGIPGRFEPWIFFKVLADVKTNTVKRVPVSGLFDGVTAPLGQMISFRGNPEGEITPKPAAATTITGVNTRALFPLITDDSKMKSPLAPTSTDPVLSHLRFQDVMDVVANPQILTTVSTDCVSCHTESTRRALMGHPSSLPDLAFVPKVSGVASTVLPKDTWNLRNFGWGFNFRAEPRGFMPTVTQRAANEAAESAAYINAHYPPHP